MPTPRSGIYAPPGTGKPSAPGRNDGRVHDWSERTRPPSTSDGQWPRSRSIPLGHALSVQSESPSSVPFPHSNRLLTITRLSTRRQEIRATEGADGIRPPISHPALPCVQWYHPMSISQVPGPRPHQSTISNLKSTIPKFPLDKSELMF
jgi:hypothetical protein